MREDDCHLQISRACATFAPNMDRSKKYILFFVIMLIGIGFDQVTKWIAEDHFVISRHPDTGEATEVQPRIVVAGDLFTFTYAENDGAFLSLGSDWNPTVRLIVLTILPGLLLLAVMLYMLRADRMGRPEIIAFSLIASGGVGNIIDRIIAGRVIDFMHMDFWGIVETGVFNIADMLIMAGIGVYIVAYFRNRKAEAAENTPPAPQA
jgi:signal peptidase II